MNFYEECDNILIYLKDKTSALPHELINPGKFERETGIPVGGAAFRFLEREKKFIYSNISDPYSIGIQPAGLVFISETSFVEEQAKKEELKKYERDKRDIDLRLGKLSILTQKLTYANIAVTLLISATILSIQILSCNREKERDLREVRKSKQDSLQQAQRIEHDSILESISNLRQKEVSLLDSQMNQKNKEMKKKKSSF